MKWLKPTLSITHQLVGVRFFIYGKQCEINAKDQTHPLDHSPTSGGENGEIASLADNVKSYKKVNKMAQTQPLGHSPTCGGEDFGSLLIGVNILIVYLVSERCQRDQAVQNRDAKSNLNSTDTKLAPQRLATNLMACLGKCHKAFCGAGQPVFPQARIGRASLI